MITTHKKFLLERCEQRNYIIEEVEGCVVSKNGDQWTIDTDHPSYPLLVQNHQYSKDDPHGPGTYLSKTLSKFGFKTSDSCSCRKHARAMNERGYVWCEENISTILSWLKDESSKRGIPFIPFGAAILVKKAISLSKKFYNTNTK